MMGAPGKPLPPGAPGAQPPQEDQVPLAPQLGFLNQPWVQNVLPFVTSLVAHAGIAVLAIALMTVANRVAKIIEDKPPVEEQVIIPDAVLATAQPAGAIPNLGDANDPLTPNRQDKVDLPNLTGTSQTPGPEVSMSAAGGGDSSTSAASDMLGRGTGGGSGGGSGGGIGEGIGSGSGSGGAPAPYGVPSVGGARGPQGPVFGKGGNARKIVFVCDATGTMINKMSVLKRELTTTVGGLKNGIQSYKIVFYTDAGTVITEKKDGLIVCSTENKKATFDWLTDVTPQGTTDPVPALQAAFKLQPDLIYFLSDGEFNNLRSYDKVLAEVVALSKAANGRIKVNTILFETIEPDAEKVMQQMSAETGGVFNKVRLSELQGD
jgi:hypothetical protein